MRHIAPFLLLLASVAVHAQTIEVIPEDAPVTQSWSNEATPSQPGHDLSQVDAAQIEGSGSVPLPQAQSRRLRKYDIQELAGSHQAIGSQLIDGRLPKPKLDLVSRNGRVLQRISFFEGNLVVVHMSGAGGTILKKLIIPDDAVAAYLHAASIEKLAPMRQDSLPRPRDGREATLRLYREDGTFISRSYDPTGTLPRKLHDQLLPLQDLLRAISEDRTVSSSVANYIPKVGDELVGEDRKVYRVTRLVQGSDIVELHCTSTPTIMYVSKQDLYNYFVGAKPTQQSELK
jgi:hypothetical protein